MKNKVAVITGGSSSIGEAIALEFSSRGFHICLVGRSIDKLNKTAKLLDQDPTLMIGDLRSKNEIEEVASKINKNLGRVDVLVNTAGVWHNSKKMYYGNNLIQTPVEQMDDVLSVGLHGTMFLTKSLLPIMIKRKYGKIINFSCYFLGPHESEGWIHYYVTNKAIEAFTSGLAIELREFKIQVNCVAPRYVASSALKKFLPEKISGSLLPSEVAKTVSYLASKEADTVSGQIIQLGATNV